MKIKAGDGGVSSGGVAIGGGTGGPGGNAEGGSVTVQGSGNDDVGDNTDTDNAP